MHTEDHSLRHRETLLRAKNNSTIFVQAVREIYAAIGMSWTCRTLQNRLENDHGRKNPYSGVSWN